MQNPHDMIANLEKIRGDWAARDREYGRPVAVALTPQCLDALHLSGPALQTLSEPSLFQSVGFGLPVYIWPSLPEGHKVFYSRQEWERWREAYGSPDDYLP